MKKCLLLLPVALVSLHLWAASDGPFKIDGEYLYGGIPCTIAEDSAEYYDGNYFTGPSDEDFINGYCSDYVDEWTSSITLTLMEDVATISGNLFNRCVIPGTDDGFGGVTFIWNGGDYLLSNNDVMGGPQIQVSAGATLVIKSGKFTEDPGLYVDPGSKTTYKDGIFVVKENGGGDDPEPEEPDVEGSFGFDSAALSSAHDFDSAFEKALTLSLTAEPDVLTAKGSWKVDIGVSFAQEIAANGVLFGKRLGTGEWEKNKNAEGIGSNQVVQVLQGNGPTLQDVVSAGGKVAIAFGQLVSLKGVDLTINAKLQNPADPSEMVEFPPLTIPFGHGFYGPAAPDGESLPITGKDIVAYFRFDDAENWDKNAGPSGSRLTSLGESGANFSADGRKGGALQLTSTNATVTGTLVSMLDWSAGSGKYKDEDKPEKVDDKVINHLAGSNAWSVAFWYRPDDSARPAIWNMALNHLESEWKTLFDGCWHHIVVTFNARAWGEATNPFEVYCDGGHWKGNVKDKQDGGWTYSWHGTVGHIVSPLSFDAVTGEMSLGGSIKVHADGFDMWIEIPLLGQIDDLLILNRAVMPDDVRGLYQTGDVYVHHVFPDVYDGETGVLNAYKTWGAMGQYRGQCFGSGEEGYLGKGGWDNCIGWSVLYPEHLEWQTGFRRDYDPVRDTNPEQLIYANGGYDFSGCDYLVDHGDEGEFVTVGRQNVQEFLGASLTLGRIDGKAGNMYLRGNNLSDTRRSIADLRLNNGYIKADSAKEMTLEGSMTVNAPATSPFKIIPDSTTAQKLVVEASVAGEADAGLTIGQGNDSDDLTVMLAGDATEFVGTLDVTAGATLELPVAGESVEELTPYDGTQMQALAGEGWVKLVLADDVQLVEGTNLLARLPKDAGIAARFTTNLEEDDDFTVSVEVVEEESKTQVFLVVKEVEQPEPPTPPEPEESVTPGEEVACESAQAATNLVEAINADKENRIEVPTCVTGGDIAAYLGYLKARVVDETKVVVDLDADRKAELEEDLNAEFTAESVAGLSDSAAPLTVVNAIPGLYYWVEGGVEPNVIDQSGAAQQAESEKTTLELAKPGLGVTAKGFFKLAVGVAAP